jgi:heat shock protein HtpX
MKNRPGWYRPDRQLMGRMTLTMFLLGLVYIVFIGILWQFLRLNLGVLIIIAGVIAWAQYYFADKIALWSMNARELSESEDPELHMMIGRLALQANLPKPTLYWVDTNVPNAFATGRNKDHAVVCVTSAIRRQLNNVEMEAVLAHELTHIINRDMLVMTIATFFSMVASLITRNFLYGMMWGGFGGGYGRRRDNDNGMAAAMIAFLASILVYVISFFLIRALSRYREYAADRGSALITGAPQNLASALMKISQTVEAGRIPDKDLRDASTVSALCIVPALRGDGASELFSTHPSLEHRLQKLREMQTQMESTYRVQ